MYTWKDRRNKCLKRQTQAVGLGVKGEKSPVRDDFHISSENTMRTGRTFSFLFPCLWYLLSRSYAGYSRPPSSPAPVPTYKLLTSVI